MANVRANEMGPIVEAFMGNREVYSGTASKAVFRDRMHEFAEATGLKLDPSCVVKICRGKPRCNGGDRPCRWCHTVRYDDTRTVSEVMLEAGRAQ